MAFGITFIIENTEGDRVDNLVRGLALNDRDEETEDWEALRA